MKTNGRHFLKKMPPWVFVPLFLIFAGYLLLTKIESVDLWWHLACGRYLFENGVYPPNGTFTFSPVVSHLTSNANTWLGDLVLYGIYRFLGGEPGLQVFRVVAVSVPVLVFILLAQKKCSTWTLLGALVIVMGTYQANLLRNSIFALFFIPLMVWLWHHASQRRNFKWLLPYPVILLLWTHMHGYALVGLVILVLFFVGEIIDQCMKKESRNPRFLLVFFVILVCSWHIVNVNWRINPVSILRNLQTTMQHHIDPKKEPGKKATRKTVAAEQHESALLFKDQFNTAKDHVKQWFRPFLKGGDAETVMEFASPFDLYAILPARALFGFTLCYIIYLLLGLIYDRKGLKASYLLPSLGCLFLGLGYVRTLAFPFLTAAPFMAIHLPDIVKQVKADKSDFVIRIRNVRPMYLTVSALLFWLLPLILCTLFALAAHYHFKEKTFYQLTQIFTREPGIGRNSKFRDALPDAVLQKYQTENLLNSYDMGGFLIWKWYGKKKVFIDSRSITYQPGFYRDYQNNYALGYLDRLGIDKSLLNIAGDTGMRDAYMSHNWALLSFDISTMLLQRPTPDGLQSTYGIVPVYMGTPKDIERLPGFERYALGAFINNTLRYMLLFGRLADALNWVDGIHNIIQKLQPVHQQGIQQKKALMATLEKKFGRINHVALSRVCRKIEVDSSPVSLPMALADAYLALNQRQEAARMYISAAQLTPEDIDLQKKIGNLMFQMKFVDLAIIQYKKIIRLNPDLVEEYITLGYFYTIKKEYDQAEKYLRKLMTKLPNHPKTYENLGLVLAAKGDSKGAMAIYKQGLSILPGNIKFKQALERLEKNIQ